MLSNPEDSNIQDTTYTQGVAYSRTLPFASIQHHLQKKDCTGQRVQ